jgi:hypothetical protein
MPTKWTYFNDRAAERRRWTSSAAAERAELELVDLTRLYEGA